MVFPKSSAPGQKFREQVPTGGIGTSFRAGDRRPNLTVHLVRKLMPCYPRDEDKTRTRPALQFRICRMQSAPNSDWIKIPGTTKNRQQKYRTRCIPVVFSSSLFGIIIVKPALPALAGTCAPEATDLETKRAGFGLRISLDPNYKTFFGSATKHPWRGNFENGHPWRSICKGYQRSTAKAINLYSFSSETKLARLRLWS